MAKLQYLIDSIAALSAQEYSLDECMDRQCQILVIDPVLHRVLARACGSKNT